MKREKQISDQQLDQWLRDVEVPADLKSSLAGLPEGSSTLAGTNRLDLDSSATKVQKNGRKFWFGLLGLAASIAVIVAVLNWPAALDDGNSGHADNGMDVEPVSTPNESEVGPGMDLSESSIYAEAMDDWMTRIEIQRLEEKLRQLKRQGSYSLGIDEDTSVILAMADQVSVELGASEDSATADMNQVIKTYPNTRGAQIAREYLASQAN